MWGTNLTAPKIVGQPDVSHDTLGAHLPSRYARLGTHRRDEAV
jgi:hypothetical protein